MDCLVHEKSIYGAENFLEKISVFFFFSNVSIKRNGAIRNRTYQLKEDKISIFLIKFSLRVKI